MASRDDILTAMRKAAGNPTAGPVKDILPALADAVAALEVPVRFEKKKETRTTEADETR